MSGADLHVHVNRGGRNQNRSPSQPNPTQPNGNRTGQLGWYDHPQTLYTRLTFLLRPPLQPSFFRCTFVPFFFSFFFFFFFFFPSFLFFSSSAMMMNDDKCTAMQRNATQRLRAEVAGDMGIGLHSSTAMHGFHSLTDLRGGANAGEGGRIDGASPPLSPSVRGLGPSFAPTAARVDVGVKAPTSPMQTASGKTLYSGPVNSSFGVDLAAMAAAQAHALAASAEAIEGAIEASRVRAASQASSSGNASGSDANNTDSSVPVSPLQQQGPGVDTSMASSTSVGGSAGGSSSSESESGNRGATASLRSGERRAISALPESLLLRLPVPSRGVPGLGLGSNRATQQQQQQQQRARDIASALGSLGGRHSFSTSCLAGLVGG